MLEQDWRKFRWYHSVDLGNGVVTEGDYDLRPLLPAYGFPDDMTGMRVLDVGRASGFFAFEFERRGAAEVIATELASPRDWDIKGGADYNAVSSIEAFERMAGAFYFAHKALNSKVKPVGASVYQLSPAMFGGERFDIVFAGSILSHIKNPVGALEALLSVTKGTLIVAAVTTKADTARPAMYLNPSPRGWWTLTDSSLTGILEAAGATRVAIMSHFSAHSSATGGDIHHTVAHAFKDRP